MNPVYSIFIDADTLDSTQVNDVGYVQKRAFQNAADKSTGVFLFASSKTIIKCENIVNAVTTMMSRML